jgi:hypothetical protein
MSMTDAAWVSRLEGRVPPGRIQGEVVKSDATDGYELEVCPKVDTDAVGEEEPSRKGSVVCSSSSLTTSAGPNDWDASGDLRDVRKSAVTGVKEPALITSALTTRTLPLTGAMITGASFKKSLAKLALDMYEFLDETAEMPERVDGAAR